MFLPRVLRLALHNVKSHNSRSFSLVTSSLGVQNNSLPITAYKLPERNQENKNNEFIGDLFMQKSPMIDFKKTDLLYYGTSTASFNLNLPVAYPTSILDLFYQNVFDNLKNNKMNQISSEKIYDLPTHCNYEDEKKVDYYKHKDPRRFTHLLWVRHRKMKKHQRIKWRKKNLAMIKRRKLERNIAKEKLFRAELLAQIQEAEKFDPETYVSNILRTIDNVPKPETPQQKYERYMELIRKNRTQTSLIMPKFED